MEERTSDSSDIQYEYKFDVSVILPIYNADLWLNECLSSIHSQKYQELRIEISAFLDSCSDQSPFILSQWLPPFQSVGFHVTIGQEDNKQPNGIGYAKNQAIAQSSGRYLCFMDADDVMDQTRIQHQYDVAKCNQNAIVGSRFTRIPVNSTKRFTDWANSLTDFQLNHQIFTSHGPTVIMPTWFCHREVYNRGGKFDESGRGCPEDLLFFFKHLRNAGPIIRCPQELLTYRYHQGSATFSVHQDTIWKVRIKELERYVLAKWTNFTIWNGGKQGRKFYRSLSDENRAKVTGFCDVDEKKIDSFYTYEHFDGYPKPKIPIVHFTEAKSPFILCMKLDMTGGEFEKNLSSLHLLEGIDYHHFN